MRERGTWAASFSAFVPRLCFYGGQNGIFSCQVSSLCVFYVWMLIVLTVSGAISMNSWRTSSYQMDNSKYVLIPWDQWLCVCVCVCMHTCMYVCVYIKVSVESTFCVWKGPVESKD